MDNNTAVELLTYIANNMQTQSRFLYPDPPTTVEIIGLLDKIAELRGITTEANGIEFNQIADTVPLP